MAEFLEILEKSVDTSIYKPKYQAALPVFRALSIPQQTVVTRLLYRESFSFTSDLLIAQSKSSLDLHLPLKLKILRRNQEKAVSLDHDFAAALREIIEGNSLPVLAPVGQCSNSDEELKNECSAKWKHLFDLISKKNPSIAQGFRPRVRQTLHDSQLLQEKSGAGFQFILSSTHKQINIILRAYATGASPQVIRFILELSVLNPSVVYKMPAALDLRETIKDLSEFGFTTILPDNETVRISYLLWNFLYAEPVVSIDINCNIYVEANFRVYAYLNTRDALEEEILCNLLSLFAEIKKKFPALVIADLTQESIKRARNKNLKGKQIIQFLEMNSKKNPELQQEQQRIITEDFKKRLYFLRAFSEQTVQQKSIIPHNVHQQILFWEKSK